jgi:tRNA-dihydrouridine synthase B
LGFDEKIPKLIARVAEDSGVDFMTIHGRTRVGKYKAKVDYISIKEAVNEVKIPIIANGDITSVKIANEVKEITGCKSLMIGRGAIGNPWIFYQIKNSLKSVSKDKIKEIVLEHFNSMVEFYGQRGVVMFRKHLHTYSKGLPNATSFRNSINRIDDIKAAKTLIEEFFSD